MGSITSLIVTIVDNDGLGGFIYLPIILTEDDTPPAPDLIVDQIAIVGGSVELTIKNVGNRPVEQVFWVDLFVNPTVPFGSIILLV